MVVTLLNMLTTNNLILIDGSTGLAVLLSTVIIYHVTKIVYNVFFHPLSRFPGPVSHALSRLPYCYYALLGTLPFHVLDLHDRYGDIVRIAPDELAFSHPDAWKDIMGHKNGEEELGKADWFYRPFPEARHIVNEERDQHKCLRRAMAHGFSEKSMRDQEPLIRKYTDLLLEKLHVHSERGQPVALSDWYNFTTFDIIGDLAFGEAFGCLENAKYDSWIKTIFESGRLGIILQSISFYPMFKTLLLLLVPKSLQDAQKKHKALTTTKMLRRLAITENRPDLINSLLKKKEDLGLSMDHLIANAEILIIGGSETTASLLSGVTYFLLENPEAHQKLRDEVRSTFRSQDEINLISVNKLSYMLACLDEGLRMYPPIANGLPRMCPRGGCTVLGHYLPANTYVSMHQWALYHREKHFTDPNSYHPERFMGSPQFTHDRRDVFQPFHVGPRNCLGRNLAYSEMRLILALIMFSFDMVISEDCHDWIQQKNFLMWQKRPLKVYLKPVPRDSP
ncbi:cytochrome P450 [Aspergillus luchuensis]|uniref:Cytochrome P450 monooxygenase n=1 Tax=Aspergillus kawachii TaxID=1069201 RepID=A0A7R7W8R8_ASPKA|nr:uncharacterized protein AKAW2_40158S [Aspergillus luchuensis]BCR98475.1 hypothetical protein AKAW2_40158S [Aspergillus luchuensis]